MFATKTFAKTAFAKTLGRAILLAAIGLLLWSFLARPAGSHGLKQTYRVKPYDTLWTIASNHYGGDLRDAIYQIEQANHLHGTGLAVGERLTLP